MRRHLLGALLAIAIALALAALLLRSAGPASAATTYMDSDWTINNGDVISRQNEVIVLTGNLTVMQGGELTLRAVTLELNSTASQMYDIEVESGGRLNVYDGDSDYSTTADASLVTAADPNHDYAFWVRSGGELYINDSRVERCGVSNPLEDQGLYIESSTVTVDHVDFKDCYYGLIANLASPTVSHSTFKDILVYAVLLDSSATDVDGCTITDCPYGVVAYYSYPKVTDTTITSASTYAIYIYGADAEIDGCTIRSSTYGIITQWNSAIVTDTVIDDVTWYGILSYYSTLTVSGDTVNDTYAGVYCYQNAAGSTVSDTKVGNSSSIGVYVYSTSTSLSNVRVYDSTTNGIYLNRASGTVSDCVVKKAAVGVYVRDSTATLDGLTVEATTSSGVSVSGGTPSMYGFSVSGSATGVSVSGTSTLKALNGTISSSTTRDMDVSASSVAEVTNVSFSAAGSRVQGAGSLIKEYWWVDLQGIWQDGSPVGSGSYTVTDLGGTTVASGTLGSDGWSRGMSIEQLEKSRVATTTMTPHSFTVIEGGLSAGRTVTVDADRTVTVTVTDSLPPSGYAMDPEPVYTQGTWNEVTWTAGTDVGVGGIEYWCEMSDSSTFPYAISSSGWTTVQQWIFSGLSDGVTYYYHVKARDGAGNVGSWSAAVSSTQDSEPPSIPVVVDPPEYTQGTRLTLTWGASTDSGVGGVQYQVQYTTDPSFTTVLGTSGWQAGTTYTFAPLADGTKYYYRVRAEDGFSQPSQWAAPVHSTQDATGPTAPGIVTEPLYTAGTTNTIYWDPSTDSGSGGVRYYAEYDDLWWFASPNDASGLIAQTQYTFTGLPEDTWFFYRVIAQDAVGNWGSWSGITWSRQDDSPPTAPVMTDEPSYTQGTTNAVDWSTSADGAGVWGITYSVEVSTTGTFGVVVAQSPWMDQQSWTFTNLADGWTYYYRVRARDALDHVSSYSNVVSSTQDASAPPAPFLAAEPQYTADASNTITWTAVADAGVGGVEYLAQSSTSPAFASVAGSGWLRGTSYTFTGLADATTYYYRVKARDSLLQEGTWSNVERSTQDASAPTAPVLAALPLFSEGTSLRLTWSASTDAGVGGVQYYAEYDNDFLFRSPNGNSGWISATDYTFTGLAEGTFWFYHVRARDDFAHASAWSALRWSIQDASAPTQPTMAAEPPYTEGTSNTVGWTASTDAGVGGVEYQVLADTHPDMASPVQSSGWTAATSFTFAGLADGTRYYYAVQARDSLDHRTALSAAVSSIQDASPPATPQMVPEPDYTQGTANTVSWSAAADAGVGGVQYRLEWSTSAAFATLAGNLDWFAGTSATVSDLADGTLYYWRVRARDSFGHETPWSNVVWSTQDASAPPAPAMAAEPAYTDGTSNAVYWSSVRDAGVGGVEYYAEVSTDASFTAPIGTGWTARTDWTFANLQDGSRYWYRARARDTFDQSSAWSNVVSSTQDDRAPTVPTLSAESAYTAGTTNDLGWTASMDAGVGGVEYEVQCSMDSRFGTVGAASPWSTGTKYTFSGLSDGVTYYYRVHARDALGHVSAWSSSQSSTQDASPPTQPVMAAEDPYTQGTANTVSWSASTDAGVGGVQYLVECALDGSFSRPFGSSGWTDRTAYSFSGLSDGSTYYYHVRARDAFGYMSPWSVVERSTQDASPPSTPAMHAEPAYTEGAENTVSWTMSVDTGVGGVLYYVEWDLSSRFDAPKASSGWVPAREWTFTGLPELRALYYHVRAMDALGQVSPWSEYVSSTQDGSPPSMPDLNDLPTYTKGRAVAVSWSPAVDLGVARVEYLCEWDDDATFGSPGGSSGWIASGLFTFDGLPESVVLSFRVRARDAFDHRTPWSSPRSTTCDASAPSVPYLASEPLYTQGTTNGLEWSTSIDLGVGGVEYRAQATTDPTWARIDLDSGWVKATAHTFSTLLDAKAYYYRVQSRDSFAWTSAWSPVVSSTQDASPPPVPVIRAEPAFTEGRANSLEWGPVADAGVGGVEYEAQWSIVFTFSTVGGDSGWTRDTGWTFIGLPEGAPTYYRLRSRDAFDQESAWSADANSTQDSSPPQVPVMRPEPAYTAALSNTVEWLAALDAGVGVVQYDVVASTTSTFSDVVADTGWVSQTRYTFRPLADGVAYYYRAKARDYFGHESAWSTAVSSTQDSSPPRAAFDPLPSVVATATLRLSGTATDAGSGVASVEVSVDGGTTWSNATLGPGGWTFTWTRYKSGPHTLFLRATDRLGNVVAPPVPAVADVDLEAPTALISSPAQNATVTGLVAVRGTAADPHIARYGLYWTRNGVNLTPIVEDQPFAVTGGTLAIWDTRGLDDGVVAIVLEVNDTTGRSTLFNVSVRLLNSEMSISPGDLLLSNPFPYEGKNLTITATLHNTGTSRARDVKITITDNGRVLYESQHTVLAGESVTILIPYLVPDHNVLHAIRVNATYRDSGRGASSTVSYTGKEVITQPFFSDSELATMLIAVVVALVGALLGAWLLDRRRGPYVVAAPGAAGAPASFASMQKVGMEHIQWSDDQF